MPKTDMSRRSFVKSAGALAALAGVGGTVALSEDAIQAKADEAAGTEEINWSQCNVNCGGNCVFKWHSKDGKIQYMETDDTGNADFQARACLRGRSMRR
jgi:anaerobic selenocysteine-containing dehydrogenase